MDTRNKILTLEAARSLPGPLSVATGLFDILRAEAIRELERLRAEGRPVLAIVLPAFESALELPARAELAAALRAVDYAVIATPGEAEALLATLEPAAVMQLENGDQRRARELKDRIVERSQLQTARHGQASNKAGPRILVVRLGAMGDIIHALPAVATLKNSCPGARLTWLVEAKWAPLLEGNPYVDRIALLKRGSAAGLFASWRELRSEGYDLAIDFQGLLKSALAAWVAAPERIIGFNEVREREAAVFYTQRIASGAAHVVDRNLALARAAGASEPLVDFPLPPGEPEGALPDGPFVLASPLAGWRSKQWPGAHYAALASMLRQELGVPLVVNGPPSAEKELASLEGGWVHLSGLGGLIHATRLAAAVVGVDSGPLHLAAALEKRGVAIFGPTDPARNGPYGGSLRVLRSASAATSYKRLTEVDESMRRITPDEVFEELRSALSLAKIPSSERLP